MKLVFRIIGGRGWGGRGVGEQAGIKCFSTSRPTLITVRIEYLRAFQFWYCEFYVENQWGRGRKHCFVNFLFFSGALIVSGWGVVACGRKPYLGPAETKPLSSQDFCQTNKHDKFWHVASTGYLWVLFLWAVAVSDFRHL